MPSFNDFLSTLKTDLLDFAEANLNEYKDELLRDGNAFVTKAQEDIKRWTEALTTGALNKKDFEFLLRGKKELAEMEALKQIGLSKIRINKITDGIIGIVVGSALKTFL